MKTMKLIAVWGLVLLSAAVFSAAIAGTTNDKDAYPLGDPDCGVVDMVTLENRLIDVQPGDIFYLTASGPQGERGVTVDLDNGEYGMVVRTGDRLPVCYFSPGHYQITATADGRHLAQIRVNVIAPPKDLSEKPLKGGSEKDGLLAAFTSPPSVSVAVGSVYAGVYSEVNKFPIRMYASGVCSFQMKVYGTSEVLGPWSFSGPGELVNVVDRPTGGASSWTLVKYIDGVQAGGTHVLSVNTPYKLLLTNIFLHSSEFYVGAPRICVATSNLFLPVNSNIVLTVAPAPGWASNNTPRTDQLYEWKVDNVSLPTPCFAVSNSFSFATPGTYQVSVECKSPTTPIKQSLTITVLKVESVLINANSAWHDVTDDSIVVLKGTKYTFKAVPAPSGVSWPSGSPIWSGVASGVGEAIDVTFDSTGTKTLTAKCGSGDAGKTVTIDVIIPEIDELAFDNSYDIHDGTERWRRNRSGQTGENEPGAFKHGEKTKVRVKFWHDKNLTFDTSVKVFGDVNYWDQNASADNYKETAMTFATTWPSPGDVVESEVSTVSKVAYDRDLDIEWRYKVPWGTDSWIDAGDTEDLVYYIVWDNHKNGAPNASSEAFADAHYTKTHIDDACEWGDGGTGEDDLADRVCASVHRSSVPGNETHTVANVWGLHDTSDGDCDDLACEMAYVMRCLGVEFYQALANLRTAICTGSPYRNGRAKCTDHNLWVSKVGISWWLGSCNNFQGCAYKTAAAPARDTICWDPQHNEKQKKYWELGNSKSDPADAPGTPPRYGILYNYHWRDGINDGTLQQIVGGVNHDGCPLEFSLPDPNPDPPGTGYEFHGN